MTDRERIVRVFTKNHGDILIIDRQLVESLGHSIQGAIYLSEIVRQWIIAGFKPFEIPRATIEKQVYIVDRHQRRIEDKLTRLGAIERISHAGRPTIYNIIESVLVTLLSGEVALDDRDRIINNRTMSVNHWVEEWMNEYKLGVGKGNLKILSVLYDLFPGDYDNGLIPRIAKTRKSAQAAGKDEGEWIIRMAYDLAQAGEFQMTGGDIDDTQVKRVVDYITKAGTKKTHQYYIDETMKEIDDVLGI